MMSGATGQRALVVGGGIGGMSCAIVLRRLGWTVDLIDRDPEWRVYGAGISITRPTLRAFKALGILDDIRETGYFGDGIQICHWDGTQIQIVPDPDVGDPDVPGGGGIMRPALHSVLSRHTRASGVHVRLGLVVTALDQTVQGVDVRFSDGSAGHYDIVIGADGVASQMRATIIADPPALEYTGQFIWRLMAPRPPEIVRRHYFLGGPVKAGIAPVSSDALYMFVLEKSPPRPQIPDAELHVVLRGLLEGFGGAIGALRDAMDAQSSIIVRPLEAMLLPPPWYLGRVLLVGDAAHPTTPQLASGAGMAVEDAIVLGDVLQVHGDDLTAAFAEFMRRRWDRCRAVVENSIEIGRREQANRPVEEQTALVSETLAKLAEPL